VGEQKQFFLHEKKKTFLVQKRRKWVCLVQGKAGIFTRREFDTWSGVEAKFGRCTSKTWVTRQ